MPDEGLRHTSLDDTISVTAAIHVVPTKTLKGYGSRDRKDSLMKFLCILNVLFSY